jgi:hypothetical protein
MFEIVTVAARYGIKFSVFGGKGFDKAFALSIHPFLHEKTASARRPVFIVRVWFCLT